MRVLITRPRRDAETFATDVRALGHTTFIEPLIDIVFADGPPLDLQGIQALLLTSANGARAVARRTKERAIRVVAVGPATAAEAAAQGFTTISESTGEGVDALAQTIRQDLSPESGALIHATGTVTAGDLKAALAGFNVRTAQLYEARAVDNLSPGLIAELQAGQIGAATFFSPRTAALFVKLLAGRESLSAKMAALTLSPAVAAALTRVPFAKVMVAAHPNAAAMLDLLRRA